MIIDRYDFKHMQDAAFVHDFSQEYGKCEKGISLDIRIAKLEDGNLRVHVGVEKGLERGGFFGYTESEFCKVSYEDFIKKVYRFVGEEAPGEEQMTIWG